MVTSMNEIKKKKKKKDSLNGKRKEKDSMLLSDFFFFFFINSPLTQVTLKRTKNEKERAVGWRKIRGRRTREETHLINK